MKKIGNLIVILALLLFVISACSPAPEEPRREDFFPSEAEVESMSEEEREAAMQEALEAFPPDEITEEARAEEEATAAAMSDVTASRTGTFEGRAHPTSGSVEIKEQDGHTVVVFSGDFKSDSGPALFAVASGHASPQNSADIHQEPYVELGPLKSTSGTQTYELPEGIDVDSLGSIGVYCKPFRVVFGYAPLN